MRKTTRSGGLILSAFVALAATSAAYATTASSVCREQSVFKSRSGIHALAGDDTFLYVGLANGKLQRITKTDFTSTDLDNTGTPITGITLDDNVIYFTTTATENMAVHHQIYAISKQGQGVPAQLLVDTTDAIGQMINDSGSIYWIVPSSSQTAADGKIERVSKSGGTVHTVASSLAVPTAIALDDSNVYFTEEGVSQQPPYGLSKIPISGGSKFRLAGSKSGEGIAGVSNGTVYFLAREDIHNLGLYSITTVGGVPPTALHTPLFVPSDVQQLPDGRFLYTVGYFDWTFGNVGGLTVFDGSNTIALSAEQISTFSADDTAIYALAGLGSGEKIDRFCLDYATAPHVSSISGSAATLGGSALTIVGQNFATGAQVLFDGTPGTVISVTPTTIQVIAPAHATGIFDLYVVNPDGESGRAQIYFSPLLFSPRKRAIEHH